MLCLIFFELAKVWKKHQFALSIGVLLFIHIFLLWYTSLPNEETPSCSSYKKIQNQLIDMSEEQKSDYITQLKETIDGVYFVQNILAMQNFQNEMGDALVKQELQNNAHIFEAYYDLYQSGDYLKFTDSLEQEKILIDEIYTEWKKVSGYKDYLYSIQENKEVLSSISIFGGQNFGEQKQDTYSARNLQKSAADYAHLTDKNIQFTPSKSITCAMDNVWIDILLFLLVMAFVGSLITEEKEKKLFLITRSTKYGILHSIGAKLMALLIYCLFITTVFYTVSLVFSYYSTGAFHLSANLQSVSIYMESCLNISIAQYIVLSIITKAVLLFGIGTILISFCIVSNIMALPFLIGSVIAGISTILYIWIPAGSSWSILKYLNLVGMIKTQNLYGGYLNFNVFHYPVSRQTLSFVVLIIVCVVGIASDLVLFWRMQDGEIKKISLPFLLPFKPHVYVIWHEAYKILITNHAFILFFIFVLLFGVKSFEQTYKPSEREYYYQDIMQKLEGELTEEKEQLVLSEKKRYQDAFQKIDEIDKMVEAQQLSKNAADTLKYQVNMTISFYPAFQRVEAQYQHIREHGGGFVYDTGYLYLFGVWENIFSIHFLVLAIGIILITSGVLSMEYQANSLYLISATKVGKRKIFAYKFIICTIMAMILTLVPIVCRAISIACIYPMSSIDSSIQNISYYSNFFCSLSIGGFVLFFIFSQIATSILMVIITLALSIWRKSQAQTIFFALLILTVPIILKLLGFEMAKWFSLYPLYSWTV